MKNFFKPNIFKIVFSLIWIVPILIFEGNGGWMFWLYDGLHNPLFWSSVLLVNLPVQPVAHLFSEISWAMLPYGVRIAINADLIAMGIAYFIYAYLLACIMNYLYVRYKKTMSVITPKDVARGY